MTSIPKGSKEAPQLPQHPLPHHHSTTTRNTSTHKTTTTVPHHSIASHFVTVAPPVPLFTSSISHPPLYSSLTVKSIDGCCWEYFQIIEELFILVWNTREIVSECSLLVTIINFQRRWQQHKGGLPYFRLMAVVTALRWRWWGVLE